jgi:hypothetical protein
LNTAPEIMIEYTPLTLIAKKDCILTLLLDYLLFEWYIYRT